MKERKARVLTPGLEYGLNLNQGMGFLMPNGLLVCINRIWCLAGMSWKEQGCLQESFKGDSTLPWAYAVPIIPRGKAA